MQVSRFCLGTMMFGSRGNPDHEDSINIIHAALDGGINFVDTADVYSAGESEEIVGKALKGRRDDVILATKAVGSMGPDRNQQGSSRRWLIREVEASLKRLQTDRIDLYQMHRPDAATSIEETLSALSDLVHQGKILSFGTSSFPADYLVEAHWASQRRGFEHFQCEQAPYSIFARGCEKAVFPATQRHGMGVITYGPLDGGWLSGRKNPTSDIAPGSTRAVTQKERFNSESAENQDKLERLNALLELASDVGVPLAHLALGFVTAHPAVTAPIIGPRTMEQLKDALSAASVELDDATLDRIDAIVPPGTDIGSVPRGWDLPWMKDSAQRRRLPGARAAG